MKMVPYHETPEFLAQVLSRSTREVAENGLFCGTPAQVAATLRGYVDAGVNWVLPVDYMPLMLAPEEAPAALARSIEVCARLKGTLTAGGLDGRVALVTGAGGGLGAPCAATLWPTARVSWPPTWTPTPSSTWRPSRR